MIKTKILVGFISSLLISISFSTISKENVPSALSKWIPWVLELNEALSCPFINQSNYDQSENHICAWPSALDLDVNPEQATFKQSWQVISDSFVPLPGDVKHWPLHVKVNNKPLAVINQNGHPVIDLPQGQYRIEGQFVFDKAPESIAIVAQSPLVNMRLNGQTVDFPKIVNNKLWLQERQASSNQQNSLDIVVSRRVSDGKYISLDTLVDLNVSGEMREEALGKVLPAGFELIAIEGELPTFLDGNGIMQVKLKPGSWTIRVIAYAKSTLLSWQRPEVLHHWPTDELWVFQSHENLRLGKVSGATMLDSSQADLPNTWYELPSYLVTAKDRLTYEVHHRGKPLHVENQLALHRTLWLSFDNEKFTFNDNISGQMLSDWRLSMNEPFVLESAEDVDGSVLITSQQTGERGIENRYPKVKINARGIIAATNELPVTGWEHNFERVSVVLNLPPGHKLFAAFGADYVSKSWLGDWTIWASFIVLFSALVASRVVNRRAGLCTALMLLFIYHLSSAPLVIIINLILAVALLKQYPFEQFKAVVKAYWTFSVALAAGAILFFVATELRTVIYPQLEGKESTYISDRIVSNFNDNVEFDPPVLGSEQQELLSERATQSMAKVKDSVERVQVTGSRIKAVDKLRERYQSDALVQAGSGIPNWHWNQYQINWNSPVASKQSFELIVLSKNMIRASKVIGVSLALLWLFLMLQNTIKQSMDTFKIKTKASTASTSKSVLSVLVLMLLLPGYAPETKADEFPSQYLLEELQQRVLQAPDCAPNCATINQFQLQSNIGALSVSFEVHANVDTAVALPRSEFWRPENVTVKNQPVLGMYKHKDWVYIPVSKGVSSVKIEGRVAPVDVFQLEFKELPRHLNIEHSTAWQVLGSQNGTLVGNALEFVALTTTESNQSSRYRNKPFVQVTRKLFIDQVWTLRTTVTRIAPSSGAINMEIPTLPGEHITSADVLVNKDQVNVTLPSGVTHYRWNSTIDKQALFALYASSELPLLEYWQVAVSPLWHAELNGVPIILDEQSNNDYFAYSFYPYAGEKLELNISRPNVVEGPTLAIDAVSYEIEQGTRTSTIELRFTYRSTRGGEHLIELPSAYQLKEIRSDGKLINQQINQGKLAIPVLQGEHKVNIVMRANIENTLQMRAPEVDLHAPLSNITTKFRVNEQRWILSASGPILGPAVLYWGELIAFILIALLVSKVNFSPLTPLNWIVLGFGLSLNNWGVLMLVALWFATLTASTFRAKTMSRQWFNVSQILLFALSIVAVLALIFVVPSSLLSSPNMGIEGNFSYGSNLQWFADQSEGLLPQVSVISVPKLFYKGLMLIWVIWLCFSFLAWIKWAWQKLGEQGYWRNKTKIESNQSL